MPLNSLFRNGTQAVANSVAAHRLFFYSVLSTLAVAAAVANALRNHSNFYSVAIYLSRSSRSLLIFANFGMILALLAGRLVQIVFFGELRPTEVERLHDRAWYFVTESLLAFTIFRDEFDIGFVLMFGFLLFIKSFHWLASDRIEWMDQRPYPGPPLNFHIRMIGLFLILWITDFVMFLVAVDSTMEHGVGGMVLFASEYAILTASIWNTVAKYLLTTYELRRAGQRGGETAPPWENKSMWVFYVELVTDFLKLTTYMAFFLVIMMFYGLPINIIRDVFMTAKSFYTRLRALRRYQVATRNMDQRYPTATQEDMAAMSDHTCIICREEMSLPTADGSRSEGPNMTPKKLPCGHIFHFYCLKSWLERQQSCPTCRRSVLDDSNQSQRQNQQPQQPPQPPQPEPEPRPPAANRQPANLLQTWLPNARMPNQSSQQTRPTGTAPHQTPVIIQQPGGGFVVQYHIPPTPEAQPPAQLQLPPPFTGFVGPGGVWQPWRNRPDVIPPPAPNPPQSSEAPSTSRAEQSTPSSNGHAQLDNMTQVSSSTSSSSRSEEPTTSTTVTPQEAAAQAALRRFTDGDTMTATPVPGSASSEPPRPPPPDNSTGPADSAIPSMTSSAPPRVFNPGPPRNADEVPRLIPLYDWGRIEEPPAQQQPSDLLRLLSDLQSYGSGTSSSRTPQPPLGQLPRSMTEDQLRVMDRLTREAIDERLKVLEGVSGAVSRCIDELMRMRSIIPPVPTPSRPQPPSSLESSEEQNSNAAPAPPVPTPTSTSELSS